jgi:hypothetical protein
MSGGLGGWYRFLQFRRRIGGFLPAVEKGAIFGLIEGCSLFRCRRFGRSQTRLLLSYADSNC